MADQQIQLKNRIATVKSADGVEGILIRSLNGKYLLRIYHGDGEFTDYNLHHSDLSVTIHDPDAFFYAAGEDSWLDHSPATLGLEAISE